MKDDVRAGFEIAAITLLLFSALLDPRMTFVLALVLIVAVLGLELTRRRSA